MLSKRHKIRTWRLGVWALCCALMLAGCGLSDWSYSLPNEYEIVRVNSVDIVLCSEEDGTVLDGHVKAFCYNDVYVGIQHLTVEDRSTFDVDKYDESAVQYYLVDTASKALYGPYTAAEYTAKAEELQVGTLCQWIGTTPKPSGEEHEKHLH